MKLNKTIGATSEIWQVFIRDSSSTTGAGLTGLAFNTAGLTAYYHKDTDTTATAITLVTMTVGTFTSSGFAQIDSTNMPGWYQFCPPNAALSSGKSCAFHLKGATNMAALPIEVQLVAVNPDSATGFVTSVPAVVGAVGSVTGNVGGNVVGSVASVTGNVGGNVTGSVGSVTGNVGGNVTGSVASVTGNVGGSVANVLALAANSVNASALAADAVTEIQTGLATSASLTSVGNDVTAVKAKTDSLTFTVANVLDSNIQRVNDVVVNGDGSPGTPWGP